MANVAPGDYMVLAKTVVTQTAGNSVKAYTRCTLSAGSDSDYAESDQGWDGEAVTLSTHLVVSFAATGTITLRCLNQNGTFGWNGGATYSARETKIIALEVDSVTAVPVSG
jgi:hypothetical protein